MDAITAGPPDGSALNCAATQALLRRRHLGLVAWAVGGLVSMAIGFALVVAGGSHASRLERIGEVVEGTVLSATYTQGRGNWIQVQYRHDGLVRNVTLDVGSAPRYQRGQPVRVKVGPARPDHATVAGASGLSHGSSRLAAVFVGGGLGGVVAAAVLAPRVRRWRRLLSRHPWRPMDAQFRQQQIGLSETLVRLEGEAGVVVLRGAPGGRGAPSDVVSKGFVDLEQVWVCGDLTGCVLLAHPGGAPMAEALPPRDERQRGDWLREFDRPGPWFPFPDSTGS